MFLVLKVRWEVGICPYYKL